MRRDYTLIMLIIPILILAFGLLFGTLDATQTDTPDCLYERGIRAERYRIDKKTDLSKPKFRTPYTPDTPNNTKLT